MQVSGFVYNNNDGRTLPPFSFSKINYNMYIFLFKNLTPVFTPVYERSGII